MSKPVQTPDYAWMWIRWRRKSSSGVTAWTYVEYNTCARGKATIEREFYEDFLEYSDELRQHSEHYRGVDVERVKRPPIAVLNTHWENAKARVKAAQADVRRLEEQLVAMDARLEKDER